MKKLKPYVSLLKLHYQIQFVEVLAGVLIAGPAFNLSILGSLVLLFLASHVLLYGGLYTINDLRDIEEDKKNEHKRHRPLPSGQVTKTAASIYATFLIGSGLLLGYIYFSYPIFLLMLLLVALNLLYTFVLKHVPFIEFLGNIITHPPRLMMGIILGGGVVSYLFLISYLFFLFGMAVVRRELLKLSKGSEHRANMKYYTKNRLIALEIISFLIMLLPIQFDSSKYLPWYLLLVVLYVIFVFGVQVFSPLRKIFLRIYLR